MKPNKELEALLSRSSYHFVPQSSSLNQAADDIIAVQDTTDDLALHTTTITTNEGQFSPQAVDDLTTQVNGKGLFSSITKKKNK